MGEFAGARLRVFVARLFALATVLAGVPHGMPPRDPALAAYALPDGSQPVICGDHPGTPTGHDAGCCLGCLPVAVPVQPALPGAPGTATAIRVALPGAHAWTRSREWQPAAARAPPSPLA